MLRTLPLALILASRALDAQQPDSAAPPPKIQDNSFLVEEAYNQETGIVQHIGTFLTRRGSSDFELAFTQEWPVGSIAHQLSYDIPFARISSSSGIGDIGINYRYQLLGDGDASVAVTPRLTLVLPTGDWKKAQGSGAAGGEIAIAASLVISPSITSHTNAGIFFTPSAKNSAGDKANVHDWSVGQSLILTSSSLIQPMLEAVYSRGTEVTGPDRTSSIESFVLAPGARLAFNFDSGLQIVPGIAVPIGIGPSSGERGVFLYLSVEHAFRR
jgi:hypothetical protein